MAVPARELINLEDVYELFNEGQQAVFDYLTSQGLLISEMHCDKCFDAETGVGEVNPMRLIHRTNKLMWRCTARCIREYSSKLV